MKLNEYELHLPDGTLRRFRLPIYRINEKDKNGVSLLEKIPKEDRFRPFYKDFIRYMLINPFYAGIVTYQHRIKAADGSTIKLEVEWEIGTHPAIVTLLIFEKVQRIRQEVGKNSRRAEAQRRIYPLSGGVLRCGVCHGRMRGNPSNGGDRYYQCSNRGKGRHLSDGSTCTQEMVPADLLEEQFAELLRQSTIPQNLWPDILTHVFFQDDVEVIDYQRHKLLAEIERCKVLSRMGVTSLDETEKEVDLLRGKIDALTLNKHPIAPEAETLLQDLSGLWQAADLNQKKTLAHSIFRSVTLSGKEIAHFELRPYLNRPPA